MNNNYFVSKKILINKFELNDPLPSEEDKGRNNIGLEFLVAAPLDYKNPDPAVVNVFLDKHGCDRVLTKNSYQIQYYEHFDNKNFNHWAERTIKILNLSSASSFVYLGFDDLVEMLEFCKSDNIIFRTFTVAEIIESSFSTASLVSSPYILAYIASKDDLSVDEFRRLCDAISKYTDKSAQFKCAVFIWPELQATEVSLLYAEKAIIEGDGNE